MTIQFEKRMAHDKEAEKKQLSRKEQSIRAAKA
jgi:hypothetical protein